MNIDDVMEMIAAIAEHQDELAAQGVAVAIAALNPETQIECMFAVGAIGDVVVLAADTLNGAIRQSECDAHDVKELRELATSIINGESVLHR